MQTESPTEGLSLPALKPIVIEAYQATVIKAKSSYVIGVNIYYENVSPYEQNVESYWSLALAATLSEDSDAYQTLFSELRSWADADIASGRYKVVVNPLQPGTQVFTSVYPQNADRTPRRISGKTLQQFLTGKSHPTLRGVSARQGEIL